MSPWLFCLVLRPITFLLRSLGIGYAIKEYRASERVNRPISHIWFMDGLNLSGTTWTQLANLIKAAILGGGQVVGREINQS